ncbi:Obg-like ATPase 1 [Armadillidium nasatum]|uniref:Obg-like ATPase 1 n=1 Tax=Armadillidium nasatum TaxID=96803 RepID=A0A5N5T2Y6_9CRUS|nr:Obg-like ATPase 1 [Armadillidium nasatum]
MITSKPVIYLVNLSEKDYIRKKNKWLVKIKEWVDANDPGAIIIPFSGALELKLFDMNPEDREKYLKENGCISALDKIIVQGYKALSLMYFFTAGADERGRNYIVEDGDIIFFKFNTGGLKKK